MKLFPKMKVKKVYLCYLLILLIIMGILLIIVLYGKQNSSKDGNILAGASPDTSAFQFYYFDGKAVTLRTLYDPAMEKELIKKINALPMEIADKDALAGMEVPFYGIRISDRRDMILPWHYPKVSGLKMTVRFIMGTQTFHFYGNKWRGRMRIIP